MAESSESRNPGADSPKRKPAKKQLTYSLSISGQREGDAPVSQQSYVAKQITLLHSC